MVLLVTISLTTIASYLNIVLTEEIKALSAAIVATLGLVLSLFFAPSSLKIILLTWLLFFYKFNVKFTN
ncbi:hypothetical protein [Myxosarcina sp. GI1(2024)]